MKERGNTKPRARLRPGGQRPAVQEPGLPAARSALQLLLPARRRRQSHTAPPRCLLAPGGARSEEVVWPRAQRAGPRLGLPSPRRRLELLEVAAHVVRHLRQEQRQERQEQPADGLVMCVATPLAGGWARRDEASGGALRGGRRALGCCGQRLDLLSAAHTPTGARAARHVAGLLLPTGPLGQQARRTSMMAAMLPHR